MGVKLSVVFGAMVGAVVGAVVGFVVQLQPESHMFATVKKLLGGSSLHELAALNEGMFICFMTSGLNCGLPLVSLKSAGLSMYS